MRVAGKRRGTIKFVPKKWRPEYDRIVCYSALGKSNTWIAEQLGFTKEYISMILNTPMGLELAEKLRVKLAERMQVTIVDNLEYVAKRTGERLRQLIDDEERWAKSPFQIIDRGLEVMKGLGHLKHGNTTMIPQGIPGQPTIGSVIVLNGEQKSDIMDGLQKIREIKQLKAVNE